MTSDGDALTGIYLDGQKYFMHGMQADIKGGGEIAVTPALPIFISTAKWLDKYFALENPNPGALKMAPKGTEFQKAVWDALLKIPYGGVTTYGAIAKAIGRPRGPQAVGQAVGHNPISIIIPCHRVIGTGGGLTGYAGGLSVKIKLLEIEGVTLPLSS